MAHYVSIGELEEHIKDTHLGNSNRKRKRQISIENNTVAENGPDHTLVQSDKSACSDENGLLDIDDGLCSLEIHASETLGSTRKLLYLWAYRLYHSEPLNGIDTIIKKKLQEPKTTAAILEGASIKLLEQWQSNESFDIHMKQALSLSLSRIINTMMIGNPVKTMFEQDKWSSIIEKSKITEIDKLPIEMEEFIDDIGKVLKQDGEAACLRKLTTYKAKLMEKDTDSAMIQVNEVYEYIGEKTSELTKKARTLNGKLIEDQHPQTGIFGRRIDLLLSALDTELCANEWKANGPDSMLLKQQTKNLRVNKCILKNLKELLGDNGKEAYILGMDWSGFDGYMFSMKEVEDVTVASYVCQLMVPIHYKELGSFKYTLSSLLYMKNHYKTYADSIELAKLKQTRNSKFNKVVANLAVPGPSRSPSPDEYHML
ncbi:hypothetical protein DFQ29_009422 [Apophysomyces sp. BC1021]|nr:hypothetical protein DFQ29_009422 [Apophysomyces sp. BC1021]